MKTKTLFLLVIIVCFILGISIPLILEIYNTLEVKRFVMNVTVIKEEIFGINADPGGFYYGRLQRGGGATRYLEIKDVQEDGKIVIYKKGNISGWISSPSVVKIKKGDSMNISVAINIPHDAAFGTYNGELTAVFRRW